ncbi:hypothetical protein K1719_031113 [Acacia pycnantha]|nr:hypothetical protein K1719_031113 [Acacia pycnantha]
MAMDAVGNRDAEKGIDQDSWKVVKKPRRQKKVVKEKQKEVFRHDEGGSRFGVLGVEVGGNGGDDNLEMGTISVHGVSEGVQFEAKEGAEQKGGVRRGEWKGEGKKKSGKNQRGLVGSSAGKVDSRQVMKREKRSRDFVQKEIKSKEELRITYLREDIQGDKMGESSVVGLDNKLEVGPKGDGIMDQECFEAEASMALEDEARLNGLEGKFWTGLGPLNPDEDMEEKPSASENENVQGTGVPETQRPILS